MSEDELVELLRTKPDGRLFHREGQAVEFKEQFNLAGLADYFRDFAAFANNRGGVLVFGVTDTPRIPSGLSTKSVDQFEKIDPEKISGFLLEIFSGHIQWRQEVFEINSKKFGVFEVSEATSKPIIAKKDEGKDQVIRNGEIYYRYGGRTQRIRYSELQEIINDRIQQNNNLWLKRVAEIGASGPSNAAVLDLENSTLRDGKEQVLVIDDKLANKLKFIREGEFDEVDGAETLKLIGDVKSVDRVEVVRRVKENRLKEYPLTATQLAAEVKKKCPECGTNTVWQIIAEERLKKNRNYSLPSFSNLAAEQKFEETGRWTTSTPFIYKPEAVDYIVNVFRQNGDLFEED